MKTIERVPEATRAGGEPGAFFYVVNFNEGGYAVVPADGRATDVYALSDEGSFDPDAHNGVRLFMDMAENYLQYEISISDSIRPSGFDLSDDGFEKNPVGTDDPRLYAIVEFGGQLCHKVVKETKSEPFYLLDTQWGQGNPYNAECLNDEGGEVSAGCVPVALGQIMAYHKQPQSYNGHTYYWDEMPKNRKMYDESNEEAYSVAYLINDLGKTLSIKYSDNKSGVSSNKCPGALEKFGYTCNGLKNYDVSSVIGSLNLHLPVYMSGSEENSSVGHAWVADGYYYIHSDYTYYTVTDLEVIGRTSKTDYYIHMNWGWYGLDDNRSSGYYYSKVFDPALRDEHYLFCEDLKMISHIKYEN